MRASSVCSEAWRDVVTGTGRPGLLAVLFLLVVGGVAAADVRAVVGVLDSAEQFRRSGAAVQVLEAGADGGGAVDGAACDALAGTDGVQAAGALRLAEPTRVATLPAQDLTTYEVTPGLLEVVREAGGRTAADAGATGGLWLSADLAEVLGTRPGDEVLTRSGPATVAGVYRWPEDGRARSLGFAVLAPVAAGGAFTQCWAQTWPVDEDVTGLLYTGARAGRTADATVAQLNPALGAAHPTPDLLAARATALAPVAAAVAGLALGFGSTRVRRLEIASALHARVPRSHLTWQHLLETVAWLAAASLVAAAALVWVAGVGNPGPAWPTWVAGSRTLGAGAAAVVLGTLAGVAATRERHLFRYFKER